MTVTIPETTTTTEFKAEFSYARWNKEGVYKRPSQYTTDDWYDENLVYQKPPTGERKSLPGSAGFTREQAIRRFESTTSNKSWVAFWMDEVTTTVTHELTDDGRLVKTTTIVETPDTFTRTRSKEDMNEVYRIQDKEVDFFFSRPASDFVAPEPEKKTLLDRVKGILN
jgi:hypothetical protein